MSESQTDTSKEELRAFEKKLHDEGAAAFADGPSPWETWDDKSDPQANNRVWEGKSKRIYPEKGPQQSLGDRVLSGLAMLSLATMVVGIAGVYFSDPQPRQVVATGTGVQPLSIDRPPPTADSSIARLEQLPTPAAGHTPAGEIAPGTDRDAPLPVNLPDPAPVIVAVAAPTGDSATQPAALPDTAAATPVTADADSMADLATRSAPVKQPATLTADMAHPAEDTGIDAATAGANQEYIPASTTGTPASPPAALTTAPVTAPATPTTAAATEIPTAPAAGITTTNADETARVAVATPEPAADTGADDATAETEPTAVTRTAISTVAPDRVDDTAVSARAPLAGPATAPDPETVTGSGGPAPVETITANAAADTATPEVTPDAAETVAAIEALPVPMAGTAVSADEAAVNSTPMPAMTATPMVVAIADQGDRTAATAPAETAEEIVPATQAGDWVVNLASYTRESTANRMLAVFRSKGVDAELVTVVINDSPMHRVRVAGFASSRAAKRSIGPLEQQLGLEGVWISRKE